MSSAPVKICIDARKLDDFGIGSYVRGLVSALAEIDSRNEYSLLVKESAIAQVEKLPDNFHPVVEASAGYSLRELISVSHRLSNLRPHLYHSTHYVLPGRLPCPAVVTIHDTTHLVYPQFLPNRLAYYYARFMIRRSLRLSRRVISVSHATRSDLERLFPGSGPRIDVVHNGVDPLFHEHLAEDRLRQQLERLGARRPYVLFVGNPKPHKNLDRLLRAYGAAVRRSDLEEHLVCVGDREESGSARKTCTALGIQDRVHFLGHVDRKLLPAVYQGAELLVHPSLHEGFGLPVVEAMASGTPVIASDIPAMREVAQDAARIVDPASVDAIEDAILRLLKDTDTRTELARRGLERARQFSWASAAERTLEVYEEALEGKPG